MTRIRNRGLLLIAALLTVLTAALPETRPRYSMQTTDTRANLADGLTAAEAVRIALERNRSLLTLRKGLDVAKGRISEARAFADPEFRTGRLDFDDDLVANRSYNVAVRWAPPRIGERKKKTEGATAWVSEVAGDIAAAELDLVAEVRLLHTSIVFLDEQIELSEAAAGIREQMLEFVDRQVAAGAGNVLDRGMAELALADARSVPPSLRLERRLALQRLRQKLDLPPSVELTIQTEGNPTLLPKSAPREDLVAQALESRPELDAISAQCSQSDAEHRLAKAERYPWFSFVQINHEFGWEDVSNSWGFRLGVDIPISRWSRKTTQAPAARVGQCQLELRAARSRISLEVSQLSEQLEARRNELNILRETVEPIASRALELSEKSIAAAQGDALQHLTARARLLRLRQTYLDKMLDYRRLEIELDRALGAALP